MRACVYETHGSSAKRRRSATSVYVNFSLGQAAIVESDPRETRKQKDIVQFSFCLPLASIEKEVIAIRIKKSEIALVCVCLVLPLRSFKCDFEKGSKDK